MKMLSFKKMLSWKCSARIKFATFLLRFSHTVLFNQNTDPPPPIGKDMDGTSTNIALNLPCF